MASIGARRVSGAGTVTVHWEDEYDEALATDDQAWAAYLDRWDRAWLDTIDEARFAHPEGKVGDDG